MLFYAWTPQKDTVEESSNIDGSHNGKVFLLIYFLHVAITKLDLIKIQATIQKQFPFELSAYRLVEAEVGGLQA